MYLKPHHRSIPQVFRCSLALLSFALAFALSALLESAVAHTVDDSSSHAGWRGDLPWSFDPLVLGCLAVSAWLYAFGLLRLWRHAGFGRGARPVQAASFMAGWLTLALALVSPIDPLGSQLFVAHMIQHELLMIVAAPLLVLGRPLGVWIWAFSPRWRRRIGRFLQAPGWRAPWTLVTAPLSAWVLHALALWLWHVPALFEAALEHEWVHTLQHSSFLLTALLFWWTVLATPTRRAQGIAVVSLFTTMLHMGALGALLTLARTVWYPAYLGRTQAFGLTALEDQQLGGLVMWVPSGFIYIACLITIAASWLNAPPPRPRPPVRTAGSLAD